MIFEFPKSHSSYLRFAHPWRICVQARLSQSELAQIRPEWPICLWLGGRRTPVLKLASQDSVRKNTAYLVQLLLSRLLRLCVKRSSISAATLPFSRPISHASEFPLKEIEQGNDSFRGPPSKSGCRLHPHALDLAFENRGKIVGLWESYGKRFLSWGE